MSLLAVFGGTFDPVHNGHIQSAIELGARLGDARVVMVPCMIPPHRPQPAASPEHRLAMLRLAIENTGLEVDDCELKRDGPSFTYDTLAGFRQEMDSEDVLLFVMGWDSWITLPTWHRWQELGDLAHLVVLTRPGESGEEPQALIDWSNGRIDHDLKQAMSASAGRICMLTLAQLPISASKIREFIARGEEVSDLVPESVNRYIQMQHLYLDVATQLEH